MQPPLAEAAQIWEIIFIFIFILHEVENLHERLRECCDVMGIGLGGSGQRDTIAEADAAPTASASTFASGKDLGDVRCANRLPGRFPSVIRTHVS